VHNVDSITIAKTTKQYDSWYERYAPDRASLRKALHGRIDKIIEMQTAFDYYFIIIIFT